MFELVAAKESEIKARMAQKWNTTMAKDMAFGSSVSDIPGFVLTAKWTRIKVWGGQWWYVCSHSTLPLVLPCQPSFYKKCNTISKLNRDD